MFSDTETYTPICPKCAETVASYGHPCMALLRDVCSYHLLSKSLNYSENHVTTLYQIKSTIKFMESKNYLLTTEIDLHRIAIVINQKHGGWDYINQRFCWCK